MRTFPYLALLPLAVFSQQPAPKPLSAPPSKIYQSPFEDYRRFRADEPLKDWKRANEEVREAGGHVGLMKGEPAQVKGHGAHGAKQPTPPAQEKK